MIAMTRAQNSLIDQFLEFAVELAGVAVVVALLLKRRKVDL
jgi:hypothetical protein